MSEQTDTPEENIEKDTIYYDQRSVALRTTQSICFVKEHDKATMLLLLLKDYKEKQVVIVVKSKKKADALSELLKAKEFNVTAVHGNHRETQQQEAASKFNDRISAYYHHYRHDIENTSVRKHQTCYFL